MPKPNTICPSCQGVKDRRALECRPCMFKNRHPRYGTGKYGVGMSVNAGGYVVIAGEYEHRKVMEGVLGRKLSKTEHVHHINGDKRDNRPENLCVLSASDHAREHFAPRAKELSALGLAVRWGDKNSNL